MGLRMKNFNIFGVHWKIPFLEGVSRKTITEGGDYLKRGAWTVCRFKGGAWQEIGGCSFEGGLIPQCTLWISTTLFAICTTLGPTVRKCICGDVNLSGFVICHLLGDGGSFGVSGFWYIMGFFDQQLKIGSLWFFCMRADNQEKNRSILLF